MSNNKGSSGKVSGQGLNPIFMLDLEEAPTSPSPFAARMIKWRCDIKSYCQQIAKHHTPPNVQVTYSTVLEVVYYPAGRLVVPTPCNQKNLYLFLVGAHLAHNYATDKQAHIHPAVKWFSAAQSAKRIMRTRGLAVRSESVNWVRGKIRRTIQAHGLRRMVGGEKIRAFARLTRHRAPREDSTSASEAGLVVGN